MKLRPVLKRLVVIAAEMKRWLSIGQGYFMDLRYPIFFAIGLKVYFPDFNYFILFIFGLLAVIFFILVGVIDDKYFKLNQRLNEITYGKYNRVFKGLNKKFK